MQLQHNTSQIQDSKQAKPHSKKISQTPVNPIFNKHKPESDSPLVRTMGLRESAKCIALMPIAKCAQLYGLEDISKPAKSLVERTEEFKKCHPIIGRIAEVVSWAGIGFGLAQAGAWLSEKFRPAGATLSDILGYTIACAHPSAIAISIRKLFKVKNQSAGISRYLEASVVGYTPAAPVFFATLGSITNFAQPASIGVVGIGRGVCAAICASIATFSIWSAAFTAWWIRVVRKEKGEGFWNNVKEFMGGFGSARRLGKDQKASTTSFHEAGEMIGTSFMVWALPWYALRAGVAAYIGSKMLEPAAFTKQLMTIMCTLEGLDVLLSGIETTIVERILKRNSKPMTMEPSSGPEKKKSDAQEDGLEKAA